jgi:outer membrane protein OmpU
MKNMMKTLFVSIASLSLMFSANAGDLAVSGSAKATYNVLSGQQKDNGIGITNELTFTASGELDNGYTWSYAMELDPDTTDGSALQDDTKITVSGDMGKVLICVSECSTSKKYAWDASAYTTITDTSFSSGTVYPANLMSSNNIQYHTPELPFGTTITAGFGQVAVTGNSGNATGGDSGDSMEAYSLVTKPVDGLTLSASYYDKNDYDDGLTNETQLEEGGAYAAKYSMGNFTIGYGKSFKAPQATAITAGGTTAEYYENTGVSVAYAVNDELTVSYTDEDNEVNYQTSSTTAYDVEVTSLQVAYTVGGATLSLARTDYDNVGYLQDDDATETLIAVAFAF